MRPTYLFFDMESKDPEEVSSNSRPLAHMLSVPPGLLADGKDAECFVGKNARRGATIGYTRQNVSHFGTHPSKIKEEGNPKSVERAKCLVLVTQGVTW